jgi:hypothetical protein
MSDDRNITSIVFLAAFLVSRFPGKLRRQLFRMKDFKETSEENT